MSPLWSIRPETTRRDTRWPRTVRRTRRTGSGAQRPAPAPGGRTSRPGWPSGPVRRRRPRMSSAVAVWRRSATRRERTSMTIDMSCPWPAGNDRPRAGIAWAVRRRLLVAESAERMRSLRVGGRAIRVAVREGTPGWPPLLLCNGIGVSLELLQPFVDALDPRRGVIRFDMPGIGGSPAPVIPYHLAASAPLLSGLLDELGYQQADVLGISWGGGLAQQFALSRPDRVHRLVLVATGPGALMVPGHPKVLLHMLTPRRHRDPGHAALIAGQLYGGSLRDEPALARELLGATARLGAARGYYYQLLSGIGWTSLPRLPRLRTPTLILAGDDDPIIPLVNARIMHRLIPDSRLHVYHGGHLELGPGAERLAPVVEAFLDAHPTAEGNRS